MENQVENIQENIFWENLKTLKRNIERVSNFLIIVFN